MTNFGISNRLVYTAVAKETSTTNIATEYVFAGYTIGKNALAVGSKIRVSGSGYVTSGAQGTLRIRIYVGANAVIDFTTGAITNGLTATTGAFVFDAEITIRTVSVVANGGLNLTTNGTAVGSLRLTSPDTTIPIVTSPTATVNVDTACVGLTGLLIAVSSTFSVANATTQLTLEQCNIEIFP